MTIDAVLSIHLEYRSRLIYVEENCCSRLGYSVQSLNEEQFVSEDSLDMDDELKGRLIAERVCESQKSEKLLILHLCKRLLQVSSRNSNADRQFSTSERSSTSRNALSTFFEVH